MTSPADPRPRMPAPPVNPSGTAGKLLNQITTRWSIVADPAKVVVRYAPAIRSYLEAILRNSNDADEVAQEFALHVMNHKFDKASPDRGRFRDYVKVSARNAALIYLRKKTRAGKATALTTDLERTLSNPAAGNDPAAAASDEWLNHWRRCLLDKVWRGLESHELASPGNLYHTALRLSVDFPNEDSESLAARTSAAAGRPLRADAFRKQLSRPQDVRRASGRRGGGHPPAADGR